MLDERLSGCAQLEQFAWTEDGTRLGMSKMYMSTSSTAFTVLKSTSLPQGCQELGAQRQDGWAMVLMMNDTSTQDGAIHGAVLDACMTAHVDSRGHEVRECVYVC